MPFHVDNQYFYQPGPYCQAVLAINFWKNVDSKQWVYKAGSNSPNEHDEKCM